MEELGVMEWMDLYFWATVVSCLNNALLLVGSGSTDLNQHFVRSNYFNTL